MNILCITFLTALATTVASAQGNLQYDQQSWPGPIPPDLLQYIQSNEPIGQSFTPALSSVGFVQFELFDAHPNNGVGATLYVNLRSNSITGPILSSTDPVFLPDVSSGGGVTNFLFSGSVPVVPGTTYFFEIVVASGDLWLANSLTDTYSGGNAYFQGVAQPLEDLWFREGIVIPEPSSVALVLFAVAIWFYVRRKEQLRSDYPQSWG